MKSSKFKYPRNYMKHYKKQKRKKIRQVPINITLKEQKYDNALSNY